VARVDGSEQVFAGVVGTLQLLERGEVSAKELVESLLRRIERYDAELNAFRVVFAERALLEAEQADARRRAGESRPLLGLPVAVKEDIDVAGVVTTFGTRAATRPAAQDAEIVRRLREAGAIVIGKTNVPEICAVPWTESPTYGATRNPWNLDRTPGGSSGGSAAAVAAGLVPVALGSDGGGSIRFPAAYCHLFGLKGQRGRLPLAPNLDAYQGLSVNGVLTRTVADTALLYAVLADGKPDPGAEPLPPVDFVAAAQRKPDRLRIGFATNLPPTALVKLARANEEAVEEVVEQLRDLGHGVEEFQFPHGPLTPPLEFTLRFLRGVRDVAAGLDRPQLLERRIRTTVRVADLFGDRGLRWAREREAAYRQRFLRLFDRFDLLLTPVTPAPPPQIGHCEGRGWLYTLLFAGATVPFAAPFNVTGQPACSIPAGLDGDGVPRAVQLVAPPNREDLLLSVASSLEAERSWAQLRPPGF
jgi:amidase